jgi:hypothetical protein
MFAMLSVEIRPGAAFSGGTPHVLFTQDEVINYWAAIPDGSRFVIVRPARRRLDQRMNVVVVENWFEELMAISSRRD